MSDSGTRPRRLDRQDWAQSSRSLAGRTVVCSAEQMTIGTHDVISEVVSRIPEWVRRELLSADPVTRVRAEETIVAMIVGALDKGVASPTQP
jgi:hypothetical protein